MQKKIRKIGLLAFLILILPLSTFFIYQFATLNESEKEINKIYIQQLETILYSINQYSEDVVSSWINDIDIILSKDKLGDRNALKAFLNNNSSINSFFISDINITDVSIFTNSIADVRRISQDSIKNILYDKKHIIDKLQNYFEADYQKIEAIGKYSNKNLDLCIFLIKSKLNEINIGGIIFNPTKFIKQNLVSKIAQSCGDKFVLSVVNNNDNKIIHASEKTNINEIILRKSLWLLPDLSLGIKMKSGTIEELSSQRFHENLLILGVLLLILMIGIRLIYFNLKNELHLTQLKSDFISNVSHELRTPLSLINMYSETLVLDRLKSEDKKREYYSIIHNETNRLTKIVNSILNFSKIEAGTRKYNFRKSNLNKINDEILKSYDYQIKSDGFSYKLNSIELVNNIVVDKDAVSESIINLIENSIKYSTERKEFIVNIGENSIGQYWEIRDFGVGISTDNLNKIFEKFFRVSSGLVYNTKGTGLGLALVKQIMDAHKGEVTVNSIIGSGSIFRLQFNNNFQGK